MNKKDVAQKMVQHTSYDRKTGKKIITMVPQSSEHKSRTHEINHHLSKYKEPSQSEKQDFQKRTKRAYND